jgi:hypothetical protein
MDEQRLEEIRAEVKHSNDPEAVEFYGVEELLAHIDQQAEAIRVMREALLKIAPEEGVEISGPTVHVIYERWADKALAECERILGGGK